MTIVTLQLNHLVIFFKDMMTDGAIHILVAFDHRGRHTGVVAHTLPVHSALCLLTPVLSDTTLQILIASHEGIFIVVHVRELPLPSHVLVNAIPEARCDTNADRKGTDVRTSIQEAHDHVYSCDRYKSWESSLRIRIFEIFSFDTIESDGTPDAQASHDQIVETSAEVVNEDDCKNHFS